MDVEEDLVHEGGQQQPGGLETTTAPAQVRKGGQQQPGGLETTAAPAQVREGAQQ